MILSFMGGGEALDIRTIRGITSVSSKASDDREDLSVLRMGPPRKIKGKYYKNGGECQ